VTRARPGQKSLAASDECAAGHASPRRWQNWVGREPILTLCIQDVFSGLPSAQSGKLFEGLTTMKTKSQQQDCQPHGSSGGARLSWRKPSVTELPLYQTQAGGHGPPDGHANASTHVNS
jgi:hypothetical protein